MDVRVGEKVPFAGILITRAAMARLVAEAERRVAVQRVEREQGERQLIAIHAAEIAHLQNELTLERSKRESTEATLIKQRQVYEGALSQGTAAPWYRSTYFTFFSAALISGGICVGATYAGK